MKANLKQLQKRRRFAEEFKRTIVKEFEGGQFSVKQLSDLHGLSRGAIYQWIYKFSAFNEKGFRIVEMKDGSQDKIRHLKEKIQELERMVGQKQIQIDYLEKMIDIAKSDLDIDIKKNYSTPPSGGSKKTGKK